MRQHRHFLSYIAYHTIQLSKKVRGLGKFSKWLYNFRTPIYSKKKVSLESLHIIQLKKRKVLSFVSFLSLWYLLSVNCQIKKVCLMIFSKVVVEIVSILENIWPKYYHSYKYHLEEWKNEVPVFVLIFFFVSNCFAWKCIKQMVLCWKSCFRLLDGKNDDNMTFYLDEVFSLFRGKDKRKELC